MGFVGILCAMGVGAVLQHTFDPMINTGGVFAGIVNSEGKQLVSSPIATGYMGMFD